MNRDCHGDYIPALKLYRCLMDSTFIDATTEPTLCTHCGRKAIPEIHLIVETPVRIYQVKEVMIPHVGWIEYERRMTAQSL